MPRRFIISGLRRRGSCSRASTDEFMGSEPMTDDPRTEDRGGEESLHALFLRCSNIISRRIGGNASRRQIIALLNERGALTQCELQKLLGIQAGSLSELVARMEKFGVITRAPDEADRRRIVIRLTPLGEERAREPRTIGDDRLFAALTDGERRALREMLQKIEDAHNRWKQEVDGK